MKKIEEYAKKEKKENGKAEIIPREQLGTTEIQTIKKAVEISRALTDVIERCKLYVRIAGKKYVTVEGWQTLGALLKCRAIIKRTTKLDNGWEAEAEIRNFAGELLGTGVARCTRDESKWKDREDYALLSMAQTRAIGKAYRNNFAWILRLAGYEGTPAEEVSGE
ncbi:MAG: hypothetical protein DRJ44_07385 [Thermoprotei archaeon]|nr:MAG: hypothetical protein DRJ44_07385 [Thermoprotei archaeon]